MVCAFSWRIIPKAIKIKTLWKSWNYQIVYLGSVCARDGWISIIHRMKRCDLSLFQLGMRLLEYFLNEELPIPVQFHVTI
jgi:hypothetical protein